MYFQISPAHKPKISKIVNQDEGEIPTLTLAPFTQIPKLAFQDVSLNSLHEIKLNIINKKPVPAFVTVCFDGPEELEFSLSWCEQKIDVGDSKILELYWFPDVDYCERHNLKVTCTRQSWNLPITFKAVSPKKTKKKISATLVKKTSPALKKIPQKATQKLSTVSQNQNKKQRVWNDKPYIPKKSHNKENYEVNLRCENFQSSSNVSFNICSPDNIRRFTYAVNKLGFTKEISPNLDDSIEKSTEAPNRNVLKGIQLNTTLDEFINRKISLDSISFLGTPIGQIFKPPMVSSELPRKDQTDKSSLENTRIIRNLSLEMNCEVQPSLNISSETRIIGNLSSESLHESFDGNTFVKNNVSTRTFTREGKSVEVAEDRYSLDSIEKFPIDKSPVKEGILINSTNSKENVEYKSRTGIANDLSSNHNQTQYKSTQGHKVPPFASHIDCNSKFNFDSSNASLKNLLYGTYSTNSNLNTSSETYVRQRASFHSKEFDQSSDSFIEKLKQLEDFDLSARNLSYEKNIGHSSYLRVGDHVKLFQISPPNCQENQKFCSSYISPKNNVKGGTSFEISPITSKISPKKGIEVFPSKEMLPTIKICEAHNLFPIKEEPTDESLRRTQIKRKSTDAKFGISPHKRQNLSPETWSKVGSVYRTRMSIERATKLMSPKHKKKGHKEKSLVEGSNSISYTERKTVTISDPFILAATTAIDPFLTNTIYLDQGWIQKQEDRFKNWLNMLLTPPSDLNVSDDVQQIDAAKLWRECSQKDVAVAPSKEEICMKYHTSSKLEALRRSASNLYNSDIIKSVLDKVYDAIEKKKIEIRHDRNVHLDLSLQSKVISLLLSYNPLWLRIGLETVYGETLRLSSNSDLYGLSKFLYERFFKDRSLLKRYKTVHNPKYTLDIKKFMLKKYFSIVYFLDKAKMNTLIPHDPCLFRKNSLVKESREMLIQFTRDAITAAVGDITKYLKYFGYFVEHRQEYINEFDYAVNSLGGDLRDGVRLTRVMELILLRNDLTQNLRVPAISRLQKIHNVKLVFESLAEAGYVIQHEIEPHHIVEGHREKTLSFLWQIIYKFQAPLVVETTKNIQKWWRSLPICVKRLKLRRQYQIKIKAATKIQNWFRRQSRSRTLFQVASLYHEYLAEKKMAKAAVKIQSFYRMYKQHKNYSNLRNTIIKLQKQCRLWLQNVCYKQRNCAAILIQKNIRRHLSRTKFLKMKLSVLTIEKYVIARKLMIAEQQNYMKIKCSVVLIQRWYRATTSMRTTCAEFLKLKSAVCLIQKKYRSLLMMRKAVHEYNALKASTLIIQRWYRSTLQMHELRNNFLNLKQSVLVVEDRYLAQREMKRVKNGYQQLRQGTLVIQRYFRAVLMMRRDHTYYLNLKNSVNLVKSKYKAKKMMLRDREQFIVLKNTTIFVQRRFRANKLMQVDSKCYQQLKKSTVVIQKYFKGYLLMKKEREAYINLKTATVTIQQKFRANKNMRSIKEQYQILRRAVISVQIRFRANVAMKKNRHDFLRIKQSCIVIQSYYRGFCTTRKTREEFLHLKAVTFFLQQKYKAKLLMKDCRGKYLELRNACILIQRKYRALKLMQHQQKEYETLKKTVNFVKSKFIANKKMLEARLAYQRLRHYTVLLQSLYRARIKMIMQRNSYLELKSAIIKIQRYFRGYILMKKERQIYLTLKHHVINIQIKFRAKQMMLVKRKEFNELKQAVVLVQRRFRANKLMKRERTSFILQREACVKIQTYFRSYLLMKTERKNYLYIRRSVITIQQKYIAYKEMCKAKIYYENLRNVVIIIQTRFRSNKLMAKERTLYLKKRNCCILIQKFFRGYLLMKKERGYYLALKSSVRLVENKYEAKRAMQISQRQYMKLKLMVLLVQRKFRACRAMKSQRTIFLKQKESAIKIQKFIRGYQQMKKDRQYFLSIKAAAFTIQKYARGFLTRKKYAHLLTPEAREERRIKKLREKAAIKIQALWRGFHQRKLSSNALIEIRKRSETASRDANPQQSLESRSTRAMEVLVTEDITVPLIISALTDIEFVTRRSPEICNKMGPLIPEQLYLVIKSVGRSLPDIQICELSVYILINLCKYEQTTSMTWYPNCLDTLLSIMTIWCDKESMVFPSLCTLFWLFAHNEEYKNYILQIPNINQRLQKIYTLVLRKQKMVMKSESKMVDSRFIPKKSLYVPGVKPDWGFDYPKKPRVFVNSVQAIECLLKILK